MNRIETLSIDKVLGHEQYGTKLREHMKIIGENEIVQPSDIAYYKNGRGVVWIDKANENYPRIFVKNIEYPEIIKSITGYKTAEENGKFPYPSFKIKTERDMEIAQVIIHLALYK